VAVFDVSFVLHFNFEKLRHYGSYGEDMEVASDPGCLLLTSTKPTMAQEELFLTTLSDSESETISITTRSELESPARTSPFIVNSPLQPGHEDIVLPSALNSSGLLPAYQFADEIEENYFCHHSTDDGVPPAVLGLGIVGLPPYGSGSTVECSPTIEGQNRNTRSKRKGKNIKSDHSQWPELDCFPSPPGRRCVLCFDLFPVDKSNLVRLSGTVSPAFQLKECHWALQNLPGRYI
jgi:hypothetical protein